MSTGLVSLEGTLAAPVAQESTPLNKERGDARGSPAEHRALGYAKCGVQDQLSVPFLLKQSVRAEKVVQL